MADDKLVFSVEGLDHNRYGVTYDQRNFVVVYWHMPDKGEKPPHWKTVKGPYFGSLAAACRRLVEIGLADTTASTLGTLIEKMEEWCQRVECAARKETFTGVKPTHKPRLASEKSETSKWVEGPRAEREAKASRAEEPKPAWMQPGWQPPNGLPVPVWAKEET